MVVYRAATTPATRPTKDPRPAMSWGAAPTETWVRADVVVLVAAEVTMPELAHLEVVATAPLLLVTALLVIPEAAEEVVAVAVPETEADPEEETEPEEETDPEEETEPETEADPDVDPLVEEEAAAELVLDATVADAEVEGALDSEVVDAAAVCVFRTLQGSPV